MKRYFYAVTIFLSLISYSDITGYDWLYIRDPKNPWYGGYGTIEEVTFTVKPKGIFAEVSVYLTFSARGLGFTHKDSLEIEFNFQLSKEAVVSDMWLWIGKDIMKAYIMDKWTASSIYENIVKRRKDPALLIKQYEGNYNLKIYPLAGDERRKIKMTYLIPFNWTTNSVSLPLPYNLVKTSMNSLPTLSIITYPDETWKNPRIGEVNKSFITQIDPGIGEYSQMKLNVDLSISSLNLLFNSPATNGKYLTIYESNSASYYQYVIFPSEIMDINMSQKVLVLIDYDVTKSPASADDVLNSVKNLLKGYLSSKDKFNVVFSKLTPQRLSNAWLPADAQTIDNAFAGLAQNPISTYSNLPTGLLDAIDFIKNNGNEGKVFLITDSDQFGDYQKANQLLNDLKEKMNPLVPFYIADFTTLNPSYNYFGDRYYRGNEYFYINLSRITGGEYFMSQYDEAVLTVITNTANTLKGFISNFDLITSVTDGFTYGKLTNNNIDQTVAFSDPIIQIGKYFGNIPFQIQLSGSYNSDVFSKKIEIPENSIRICDSTLEQLWTGNYINLLEQEAFSNDKVSEIVQYSISRRVLSIFSAFLALEPNDTIKFCTSCYDESTLPTDIEDQPTTFGDSLKIQAYPNPFNSQTKIKVELPALYSTGQLSLKIYDMVGQVVKTYNSVELSAKNEINLSWNGTNDAGESVASGIYIFVAVTPNAQQTLKLLNLK